MTPRSAFGAALLAAVALDVTTKTWAAASLTERSISLLSGRLLLRESRNTGAAFSIGTDRTVLISLFAIGVVAAIAWHLRKVRTVPSAVAWGLIAGGATGNLIDRLLRAPGPLRGGVVDWIDLGWFPSFNGADSVITTGVVLLLLVSRREERASSA